MGPMKALLVCAAATLLWPRTADAGLLDFLGFGHNPSNQPTAAALPGSLSQDQVVQGLKEALAKGVQHAVSSLGHDDGFLTNLQVKIPVPPKLHTVEKTLRLMRQDQLADDFIATMNHAAEQAVPQAAQVFGDAIKTMSITDAKAILVSTNNAATQYFRRTTETNLFARFKPIVKQATDRAGVTSAYKRFMANATQSKSFVALGQSVLGTESLDLDSYVTTQALDGLFTMIAQEEGRIRENPLARTSDLLQQVFGAAAR